MVTGLLGEADYREILSWILGGRGGVEKMSDDESLVVLVGVRKQLGN